MEQGEMQGGPRGIILAGVHRWDDAVLERSVPRPLLPIANRPLIEHILSWLNAGGVRGVSVCANSDTHILRQSLGTGTSGRPGVHYYEDHMPRGPAGCAKDVASQRPNDTFVVVDGTILPQAIDLARALDVHNGAGAAMTIVVTAMDGNGFGGSGQLSPTGVYILAGSVLSHVGAEGYQDIKETLIPRLHDAGERAITHQVSGPVPRIRDVDSCLAANGWLVEHLVRRPTTPAGYRRIGDALVHETARVVEGARLIGPMIIGPHSTVEGQATIVGPTAIGAGCTVCSAALVCRSALWDAARVQGGCLVDRCILTYNADLNEETTRGEVVCPEVRA